MNALKHFRISLCMICLTLFMCSCSKPVEVQISEQLDLGHKYMAEQNYEQAVIAFSKVIELDEKNVAAYEGLGEAHKKLGKTEDAIAAFETAVELDPANIQACLSLSELYGSSGDDEKAEEYCNRILEIDPDNSDTKKTLIRQYRQAAETAEDNGSYMITVECYEKILEVDPEDQDAKNKLESLKNLRRQKEEELIAIAEGIHGGDYSSTWSFKDFNGDGAEDLFIAIDSVPAGDPYYTSHWKVYYVDSSGDCQKVTEFSTEDGAGYRISGMHFERDGTLYYVHAIYTPDSHDTTIRYFVFAVINGKPQLVSDGHEIRLEDIRAGKVPM